MAQRGQDQRPAAVQKALPEGQTVERTPRPSRFTTLNISAAPHRMSTRSGWPAPKGTHPRSGRGDRRRPRRTRSGSAPHAGGCVQSTAQCHTLPKFWPPPRRDSKPTAGCCRSRRFHPLPRCVNEGVKAHLLNGCPTSHYKPLLTAATASMRKRGFSGGWPGSRAVC